MLLTESPATPDTLVVGLKTIVESDEDHLMAVLQVNSEASDFGFGDQNATEESVPIFKSKE